jgi:hypothetical protein
MYILRKDHVKHHIRALDSAKSKLQAPKSLPESHGPVETTVVQLLPIENTQQRVIAFILNCRLVSGN